VLEPPKAARAAFRLRIRTGLFSVIPSEPGQAIVAEAISSEKNIGG